MHVCHMMPIAQQQTVFHPATNKAVDTSQRAQQRKDANLHKGRFQIGHSVSGKHDPAADFFA